MHLLIAGLLSTIVLLVVSLLDVRRAAAQTSLSAEQERALKGGDTFQECGNCPVMVVVPAGHFMMGSPAGEPGRKADESPQHAVTIARPFAVGRFVVTYEEWDACINDGGCGGHKPAPEWGRDRQPV